MSDQEQSTQAKARQDASFNDSKGASHTPDRWAISLGALNVGDIEIGDEHGDIVVTVHTMQRRYHGDIDKAWKTARLIAAAPELLEQLKLAEKKIRDLSSAFLNGSVQDECISARAAIAKAEGR